MKLKTILTCVGLSMAAMLQAKDIYVSPHGNDAHEGSSEKPLATLTAARDLIRHYKSIHAYPGEGYTVWVAEGNYELGQTFVLNELDSGSEDQPIVWRAQPGARVSISGGRAVGLEQFERVGDATVLSRLPEQAKGNVLQVDLKKLGLDDYGQITQYGHAMSVTPAPLELFYEGEAMTLARYPNEGYVKIGKVLDKGSVPRQADYSERGGIFEYEDERHAKWAGQDDVWLQGTFMYGFADDNLRIAKIDTLTRQVHLAMPSMYGVGSGRDFRHYVAYNILEELDRPGEWYLDRKNGLLYFWPPESNTGGRVHLSVLEQPVISLEGVNHVAVRDFTVENGRGIGIYIERGSHNQIAGCTVRNMGTSGIFMGQGARQTFPHVTHDDYDGVPVSGEVGNLQGHIYKYTQWERQAGYNHEILSCDVYNTGSGGIYLSGGSKRELTPGNNSVVNCKVHNYNRRNKFLWSGINIDGCGNRIAHCEIFDSEWQAIYVHGNEHLFEYNNIHHVTLNSDDTSPWYIGRDPSDRGNVIRYNYFHHCGNPKRMNMGIYADDSSSGLTVYGNVFYKMNARHGILFTNSGWDLKMENNIIIEPAGATVEISAHYYTWYSGQGAKMFGEEGLLRKRLTENVKIYESPYAERYPELLNYLDKIPDSDDWEGMRSRGNVMRNNLIVGGPEEVLHLKGGEHAQCDDINNYHTQRDPGFVDMEGENFMLKPKARAIKKIPGFEPLPFNKMGLYIDEYREQL